MEVDQYEAKMGQQTVYMESVVNIFTRLNTAGRTLTREEITFAWVKSGWLADKVPGQTSANSCFADLLDSLSEIGLAITLDDLMAGVAFVWSIVFRNGRVLSQRDMLDANSISPMAVDLSNSWESIRRSIHFATEAIYSRGLKYGQHFQSLNALYVLWAWSFTGERWRNAANLKELQKQAFDSQIRQLFDTLCDRWLIGSQWAGYWGFASLLRVGNIALRLHSLSVQTASAMNQDAAIGLQKAALDELVEGTIGGATDWVERLSADDRSQVRQYYAALWMWHRLCDKRWHMSVIPLRQGKKSATLDVDHVVAVKLWEKFTSLDAKLSLEDADDEEACYNDLGNCLLLETSFNISKSDSPLGDWLKEMAEFKAGSLSGREAEWAESFRLPQILLYPRNKQKASIAQAIADRTTSMKAELISFITGKTFRRDIASSIG